MEIMPNPKGMYLNSGTSDIMVAHCPLKSLCLGDPITSVEA